jgi:hypothetical protein
MKLEIDNRRNLGKFRHMGIEWHSSELCLRDAAKAVLKEKQIALNVCVFYIYGVYI